MSFKLYFEKLTLFQKLELYILVVMIYGTVFYFSNDLYHKFSAENIDMKQPEISKYNYNLQIINLKVTQKSKIAILNLIEKNSTEHNIFTKSINIVDDKIELQFSGDFYNMIDVLKFYQTHFHILYYKLEYSEKKIFCNLSLNVKYIFDINKKNIPIKKLSNPFIIKNVHKNIKKSIKQKLKKPKKQIPLKVLAIVSSEVLIGTTWYKKGDIIGTNKIVQINFKTVELKNINNNKISILKVYDE